jgi:hypothetical protein
MHFKPASKRSLGALRRRLRAFLCDKVRHEKHHRLQRKLPSQALSLKTSQAGATDNRPAAKF